MSLLKRGTNKKLHKYITYLKVILIYTNAKYTRRINKKNLYKLSCNGYKKYQIRIKHKNIVIYCTIEKTDKSQYKQHLKTSF